MAGELSSFDQVPGELADSLVAWYTLHKDPDQVRGWVIADLDRTSVTSRPNRPTR